MSMDNLLNNQEFLDEGGVLSQNDSDEGDDEQDYQDFLVKDV
jgi:hypothetical protein